MNVFENLKLKSIDEFAEWLDENWTNDDTQWIIWFNDNYCSKCEVEIVRDLKTNRELECSWCELYNKCKYFKELNDVPDSRKIIKMWLESEY